MKFSECFFAPGVRPLSVILGVILGGVTAVFTGWEFGVLIGASSAIAFSLVIPVFVYRREIPYNKIKKTLEQPFLFDEWVHFTIRNGSVGGYFVLTEKSMIFLSFEQGDHRMELARKDVKSVIQGEDSSIRVFLDDQRFIRVISTCCEEMIRILRENGWNVN